MKKSPVKFAKYVAGGIKMALTHPQTDKTAKLNATVWGILVTITLVNVAIATLLGNMNGFMVGFTLVGLCIYAVCLRWALKGLQYRAMLRREASDREAFNQIVSGL